MSLHFNIKINGETVTLRPNHVTAILLIYYSPSEYVMLQDFMETISKSYRYINGLVVELQEMGLIEEKQMRRFRLFKLTEKGKKVAEKLDKAMKMLEK